MIIKNYFGDDSEDYFGDKNQGTQEKEVQSEEDIKEFNISTEKYEKTAVKRKVLGYV